MMKKISLCTLFLLFTCLSFVGFSKEEDSKAPTALVMASSMNEKVEKEVKENKSLPHAAKTKAEKKEILEKVKELKAEVEQIKNTSAAEKKSSDWDPKFKIGAILTVVAILLAIVGIGWVAGLAALVGLFFLVVGLLHTYN